MYETCVKQIMKHTLQRTTTILSVGFVQPSMQSQMLLLGFVSLELQAH